MKREFKFRAWVVEDFEKDGNTPKTFKMHHWDKYFFTDASPVTGYSGEFPEPNDPCVFLMPSTGLKDVQEVEIYEGDILRSKYPSYDQHIFEVQWTDKVHDGGFQHHPISKKGTPWNEFYGEWMPTDFAVIGNIHENPELLK